MKSEMGLIGNIILGIVGALVLNAILRWAGHRSRRRRWLAHAADHRHHRRLHPDLRLAADPRPQIASGALVVTLIDTLERPADGKARPRHPEKAHRPDKPVLRKPDWIRVRAPGSPEWAETRDIVRENKLVTVCEEAGCPNIGECWSKKHATFMILGDTCTRACAFCNVKTGLPGAVDAERAGARRRRRREDGAEARRGHLGRPRRSRRRRGRALRRRHPRHPRAARRRRRSRC